jgi:hypothetical protein
MPCGTKDFSLFERKPRQGAALAQTTSTNASAPKSAPGVIPPGGTAPSVAPGTPAPDKPATDQAKPETSTPSKEPYISLTVGGALGPAYWTTLTMTSSALYLSLNHGSGGGLEMLSLTGGLVTGNPDSVFTGVSGVATGGTPIFVGGSAQVSSGGHAVDVGFSTPGGAVGLGYGFKIYDAKDAQRNPQVFKDNNGTTLERCY